MTEWSLLLVILLIVVSAFLVPMVRAYRSDRKKPVVTKHVVFGVHPADNAQDSAKQFQLVTHYAHQAEEYKKSYEAASESKDYFHKVANDLAEKNVALSKELAELKVKYEKVVSRPTVFARREIDLFLEEPNDPS